MIKDKIISLANIAKPVVELKKLRFFKSREWGEFGGMSADVWINGVKCMEVIDEGNGGCYNYTSEQTSLAKANIKLLEHYIKTIPEYNYSEGMDAYFSDLGVKQYEEKKMLKLFEKAICYGVTNGKSYRTASWKDKTLVQIDKINLQCAYNEIKKNLKAGEIVFNTNLQKLGINI